MNAIDRAAKEIEKLLDLEEPRIADILRKHFAEPAERADQWQDIATAPKDGTPVLPERSEQMWHDWKGVTEPDWYWWWNGDEDCCGVPVSIGSSWNGNGYDYFATMGQLGWNRHQMVEEMGGLWCRAMPPALPPQEQARG